MMFETVCVQLPWFSEIPFIWIAETVLGNDPVMVTEVPPAVGPEAGAMPEIELCCTGGRTTTGAAAPTTNWTPDDVDVRLKKSDAVKSTAYVPIVVGVPPITPPVVMLNPGGRVPLLIEIEIGRFPPVVATVEE